MANAPVSLAAESRTLTGTANSRRLRNSGRVPATVYGPDQEPASVSISGDLITQIVLSGSRIVDLDMDGSTSKAMLREIQWDTFLTQILHVDLQRIDEDARVNLDLPIEIRGSVNQGVLEQVLRFIEVNVPVFDIPANPVVRVGSLDIGDAVTVAELGLPAESYASTPGDTVVLRVVEVQEVEIDEEDVSAAVEPEVIGRKADEEEPE
ncbi:MAG: 50S ribosomal protein L25 [Planctomycetaceae bacterium]